MSTLLHVTNINETLQSSVLGLCNVTLANETFISEQIFCVVLCTREGLS
jgi:hypothetical protein